MTLELTTARLKLRPFVESDLNDYFEIVKNQQSAKAAGFQYARNLEDAHYLLKQTMRQGFVLAVVERTTARVIGSIGFYDRITSEGEVSDQECDLGYVLNEAYWGHGYMTEAGQALIHAVFDRQLFNVIWASFLKTNAQSQRVLVKLGFHYVDEFQHPQNALYQPGQTEVIYQLARA
ncbi:GNAT family N-acetyltransferase [Secundilactobacillus muriivasis]